MSFRSNVRYRFYNSYLMSPLIVYSFLAAITHFWDRPKSIYKPQLIVMWEQIMKTNRSTVELNSLNTGKLGIEQSQLVSDLNKAVVAYMDYFLRKRAGEKVKMPISLKNIQKLQSHANARRRKLGLDPVREIQFLRDWKREMIEGETFNDHGLVGGDY